MSQILLTPAILALGGKVEGCCKLKAVLGYVMSSRPVWATEWNLVSKSQKCKTKSDLEKNTIFNFLIFNLIFFRQGFMWSRLALGFLPLPPAFYRHVAQSPAIMSTFYRIHIGEILVFLLFVHTILLFELYLLRYFENNPDSICSIVLQVLRVLWLP